MSILEAPSISTITKLLLIGDSGSGKTGSLAALIKDGYKLRILDFDNKIVGGILPTLVKRDCADKMKNVEFESLRDKKKASALGFILDGMPQAYTKSLALLDKWSDGTNPKEWGSEYIMVIDSLTFFADAAYNWAKGMNPSVKDPRQWFYTAQGCVKDMLSVITGDSFKSNAIVISHVDYQNRPDGTMKGFPTSIGSAFNPEIPTFFENLALCQVATGGKRQIQTLPTALVDLKNPAAFKMAPTFPIETGLSDFFKTLRS